MASCVFCEIVARNAVASFVAESALAIAFLTIGPLGDGHTLVIPKRHVAELPDASPDELAAVFALGQDVAHRQRRTLGSQGETLTIASGVAAEQSVFHLHLHVIPRRGDDNLDHASWWAARMRKPPRDELDAIAARLRSE